MDFANAWCPVCDRQIIPKRHNQPIHPPPPPPQPAIKAHHSRRVVGRAGLVEGTGARAFKPQQQPPQPIKTRLVIDQGPLPYYCSDTCRVADLNDGVLPHDYDPNRLSPPPPSPTPTPPTVISNDSASIHADESPSMAYIATKYNFPALPKPFYSSDDDSSSYSDSDSSPIPAKPQFTSGVMMAHEHIISLSDQAKADKDKGNAGVAKGWNDGSNAWRAVVYNLGEADSRGSRQSPVHRHSSKTKADAAATRLSSSLPNETTTTRASHGAPKYDSATTHLMAQFSASLTRRSESRLSLSTSPPSTGAYKERPLLPPGAVGKILAPEDMKVRVRLGSAENLSPTQEKGKSQTQRRHSHNHSTSTNTTLAPNRPLVRSPLSFDSTSSYAQSMCATMSLSSSDSDLEEALSSFGDDASHYGSSNPYHSQAATNGRRRRKSSRESDTSVLRRGLTGLSIGQDLNTWGGLNGSAMSDGFAYGLGYGDALKMKRPQGQTRAWSYDNVRTYDAMEMPNPEAKLWNFPERLVQPTML